MSNLIRRAKFQVGQIAFEKGTNVQMTIQEVIEDRNPPIPNSNRPSTEFNGYYKCSYLENGIRKEAKVAEENLSLLIE
ncbi:MAG: hypothetical protein BGO32_02820 [Bacteroidetes bacterium 37-13]|nr:MAG: hypothetical protein BGO32_02820 [Bacteroidetes bacterium 37-13]